MYELESVTEAFMSCMEKSCINRKIIFLFIIKCTTANYIELIKIKFMHKTIHAQKLNVTAPIQKIDAEGERTQKYLLNFHFLDNILKMPILREKWFNESLHSFKS